MSNNDPIGFFLVNLSTDQFALLKEDVNIKDRFDIQTQVRFGVSNDDKLLAVLVKFRFEQNRKPFIILEVSSKFKVRDEDWASLTDEKGENIAFPRNFILHLTVLTVGAARGILHAKTENSIYHSILLPTINVNELIDSEKIILAI